MNSAPIRLELPTAVFYDGSGENAGIAVGVKWSPGGTFNDGGAS